MLWVICKFKFIIIFYYFGTLNCKMVISPGFFFVFLLFFFHFFNILIFQVVSGVKGKKMTQKDKKFSLLHSISQELYIIWLSFLVHIFKMIISPCILIFEVVRGLKGEKWHKMTKNSICCTPYLRNYTSYDHHLWCTYVKW